MWELASGHELHTLTGHSGSVRAVAVTRDRRWAVSASGTTLQVWLPPDRPESSEHSFLSELNETRSA